MSTNKRKDDIPCDPCVYSGKEASPKGFGYCAHEEKLGKIREGKDGGLWKVVTKGNQQVWKKLKDGRKRRKGMQGDIIPGSFSDDSDEENQVYAKKHPEGFQVIFTDPTKINSQMLNIKTLSVSYDIMKSIRKGPQIVRRSSGKNSVRFSFIFGKNYPFTSYRKYSKHDTFSGLTALLDSRKLPKLSDYTTMALVNSRSSTWNDILKSNIANINWESKKYLHLLRKDFPELLWIAYIGGALTSYMYVHFNSSRVIDSIIITAQKDR